MTPEERKMLAETLELARENHEILKKMRRGLAWARAVRVFYWVVIIGVSVGAFYFIQPYVESLTNAYDQVTGVKSDIGNYFNF